MAKNSGSTKSGSSSNPKGFGAGENDAVSYIIKSPEMSASGDIIGRINQLYAEMKNGDITEKDANGQLKILRTEFYKLRDDLEKKFDTLKDKKNRDAALQAIRNLLASYESAIDKFE